MDLLVILQAFEFAIFVGEATTGKDIAIVDATTAVIQGFGTKDMKQGFDENSVRHDDNVGFGMLHQSLQKGFDSISELLHGFPTCWAPRLVGFFHALVKC
jgi:hypothetical protein